MWNHCLLPIVVFHSGSYIYKMSTAVWAVCLIFICFPVYAVWALLVFMFLCFFVIFVFCVFCKIDYWQFSCLSGRSVMNKGLKCLTRLLAVFLYRIGRWSVLSADQGVPERARSHSVQGPGNWSWRDSDVKEAWCWPVWWSLGRYVTQYCRSISTCFLSFIDLFLSYQTDFTDSRTI